MSIRTRLLLLAMGATLLCATFLAWRFVQERERDIAAVTQRLPAVASGVANALGERIQGTEQLHFGLARAHDIDVKDQGACSAFLSQVLHKYPQYTGILTIDPTGQLVCDSLNSGRRLDLSDRDYFKRALTATDTITLQPAFGRLTNKAVLQIAYPVRAASGQLKFVLLASLGLEQLAQTGWRDALMPGVEVLLVDRAGVVLASSGGPKDSRVAGTSISGQELLGFAQEPGRERTREIVSTDGTTKVWAVPDTAPIMDSGVLALVGYPRSLLVAAADRRFAEDMAVLAAFAMAAFLGIWFFAEMAIRRPIATIAAMVTRLGHHESEARIPGPYPRGELGVLMQVLNQSAQSQALQRTALEELNAQLRDAQRLESIGQLTGGVAHDFNNLLTVILGNTEVLLERLRDKPQLASLASMVLDAAERGAELTQRLLAFARKQPLKPRMVDVNELVENICALLRRTLGEHIELRLVSEPGLWPALIDPAQLDNALLNLCLNSRDAMPNGGRLTIETGNACLTPEYAQRTADVRPGDYVMLAVSDTGCGIDPKIIGRVFEPFFTTKAQGKGTGLGMAMVHGFLKQSGGHIALYSEVGRGTCLKLYLPRAAMTIHPTPPPPANPALVGGSETILLVEDDALVRRYAHEQLVSLGYRVVEANRGPQALSVLRSGTPIDLLFTDVVMPGMSGAELVVQARRAHPALKVLYTSGYTENALIHHGRLDEGVALLTKPYRREELAAMLRRALASPSFTTETSVIT